MTDKHIEDSVPLGQTSKGPYQLIATRRPPDSSPPYGWVSLPQGSNVKRRKMTEGYLNQRMPRGNTIAMNQNYVMKVLDNPRTPRENRETVIAYVLNHPDKFTPLADRTDDPVQNEWASKVNGNAQRGFMREFRKRFL